MNKIPNNFETASGQIDLGASFSSKDFILDIQVNLNGKRLIDLEMQLVNQGNWPERSISYAARSFDNLNRGDDYLKVTPVNSIGFLNFTLFPDAPEFFATYRVTVHTNLHPHAQSRRLRLLSRSYGAKIAYGGRGYVVTQHMRNQNAFLQANLTNVLWFLICRVNSNLISYIKTRQVYSSKFSIHVVDLSRIDLATDEDKEYGIDRWARLFKSKTWEELRMIAEKNPILQQASNDLYTINADEILRQQARARADAEFWERHTKAKIQKLEEDLAEKDKEIELLRAQLAAQNNK